MNKEQLEASARRNAAVHFLAETEHDSNCAMLIALSCDACDCSRPLRALEKALKANA